MPYWADGCLQLVCRSRRAAVRTVDRLGRTNTGRRRTLSRSRGIAGEHLRHL